jgi:uncharacterized protein Veg
MEGGQKTSEIDTKLNIHRGERISLTTDDDRVKRTRKQDTAK